MMVESLKHMPFNKHVAAENAIYTNNIFAEGVLYYREIEEGFWILITEIEFKKNVSTNALYNNTPCDYHFLSHFIYTSPIDGIEVNGVTIPTVGWSLYKPGTEIKSYFNKGDKGVFANFAFSETWFEGHDLGHFMLSDKSYFTWENILPDSELLIREILDRLKVERQAGIGSIPLKIHCLQFISNFFSQVIPNKGMHAPTKLQDADRRLVARAEKILTDNLTNPFLGIEGLALLLNTSPTKLKGVFKAVHHNSIFQYYQRKQMLLALQMLRAKPISLKSISLTFGYSNPSKFSTAFKKYHNFLPSEI